MTMQEILQETSKDSDLQTVILNVRYNTWNKMYPSNKYIGTFWRVKNQLIVSTLERGDILLHETKLVIPRSLQRKVIQIAHEGHQCIVRTKQLLREKVYFPNIDKLVEETCQSCIPCLAATEKNVLEPLKKGKMPENAFDQVYLDFCGPFPDGKDGKYLLVLIDEHSRFPIVEILSSINAKTEITVLDKIFSKCGIP